MWAGPAHLSMASHQQTFGPCMGLVLRAFVCVLLRLLAMLSLFSPQLLPLPSYTLKFDFHVISFESPSLHWAQVNLIHECCSPQPFDCFFQSPYHQFSYWFISVHHWKEAPESRNPLSHIPGLWCSACHTWHSVSLLVEWTNGWGMASRDKNVPGELGQNNQVEED